LLNLDNRDFVFWYKEATKKNLSDFLRDLQTARAGMAKDNQFRRIITEVKYRIMTIEIGRERIIKENWDSLRRGQG